MKASNLIAKAMAFAEEKHKNQKRKITKEPYINHIYQVKEILENITTDQITIVAGILHDTLEDTDTTNKEIFDLFGKKVLDIVLSETENKTLPYIERKQEKIDELAISPIESKIVKCADMLSNITDMQYQYEKIGDDVWNYFNAPKKTIGWYYKSMLKNMHGIEHLKIHINLKEKVDLVFGN